MTGRPVIICLDPDDLIREGYEGWIKSTHLRVQVEPARNFDEGIRHVADAAKGKRKILVITALTQQIGDQLDASAGVAFVIRIQSDYPAAACIVVDTTVDRNVRSQLLQMQIPFLDKPASPDVLLPAIQDALRNGKGSANYAAQGGSTPPAGPQHD